MQQKEAKSKAVLAKFVKQKFIEVDTIYEVVVWSYINYISFSNSYVPINMKTSGGKDLKALERRTRRNEKEVR
jgi:hypothetical protein